MEASWTLFCKCCFVSRDEMFWEENSWCLWEFFWWKVYYLCWKMRAWHATWYQNLRFENLGTMERHVFLGLRPLHGCLMKSHFSHALCVCTCDIHLASWHSIYNSLGEMEFYKRKLFSCSKFFANLWNRQDWEDDMTSGIWTQINEFKYQMPMSLAIFTFLSRNQHDWEDDMTSGYADANQRTWY